MRVMDKLTKDSRGSFVFTLLQGRALEVIEHLKPEEYQKEGGDDVIFTLLDRRWPEKDRTDEIGENIAEVFALKAKEGEGVRQWCARAREVFDRCSRKSGVTFPEEAKGWLLLHCSGMGESDRAVILARAQGDLKMDAVSQSMRSCFPDYVVKKKSGYASAHVVEDLPLEESSHPAPADAHSSHEFEEIEQFLAEHGHATENEPDDPLSAGIFEEAETAEILAVSWKEKRAELGKLQKARKFQQASDLKRSFHVEINELRRRSKCFKCHKLGHFARECRSRAAGSSSSAPSNSNKSRDFAASAVQWTEPPVDDPVSELPEHFVCTAGFGGSVEVGYDIFLVSSPGFAVLDSGCGKTIIGSETLEVFKTNWTSAGINIPEELEETNVFRYGNGHREVSHRVICMPVFLAGKFGRVRASVVKGSAPLLLSRPALKTLRAKVDFEEDQLTLWDGQKVPLEVNQAGQYIVDVSNFPMKEVIKEVTTSTKISDDSDPPDATACASVTFNRKRDKNKDYWEYQPKNQVVIRHHLKPRRSLFTPCMTQCPVEPDQLQSCRLTKMEGVFGSNQRVDQWTDKHDAHAVVGTHSWIGQTVFRLKNDFLGNQVISDPSMPNAENEVHVCQWTPKQHRSLTAQLKQQGAEIGVRKYQVIEVFSPPRFALECAKSNKECISADLCTGWDFRKPEDRRKMKEIVKSTPPELLVLCPPCTWAGGWFHLNKVKMSPADAREKEVLTRLFVRFCGELIDIQLANGGRVMFEHPLDSVAWILLKRFQPQMFSVKLHMCCYGLRLPSGELIRKPTMLMVSHEDMCKLGRICPGQSDNEHKSHHPIAGSVPGVGSVSRFAGKYPSAFVKAVLKTTASGLDNPILMVMGDQDQSHECLAASRLEDVRSDDEEKLIGSIKKLHHNLGHPSNNHLIRILRHGGASEKALQLARSFSCQQCQAHSPPGAPMPAQTQRVTEFNSLVGIDIKYLQGWKVNQKIPALNILDYASSMQLMIPIFQRETSDIIREKFFERWVSWAGMPTEIVCDPAKPNVADALTVPLEQGGSTVKITAADAHWQLGKTEVHGGWFNRILNKVIEEQQPNGPKPWMECVLASHCKNQLIQVYGMTPSQFVFGKNPRIPENLLDEPLEVVPATASLYQEAIAKQVAIRQSARRAVVDLQDNRALRLALAARPRVSHFYSPGAHVAYWRSQKWVNGQLESVGKWHGPATVLGYVGRNLVIIHKRQIFRCAPEQVRPSTLDESRLIETPDMDLLGIKESIEKGAIQSKQYVDLVPEAYPGQSEEVSQTVSGADAPSISPAMPQSLADRMDLDAQPPSAEPVDDPNNVSIDKSPLEEPSRASAGSGDSPKEQGSSYGPVRRRIGEKAGPMTLYRPARASADDFADMMKEIVPQLIQQAITTESTENRSRGSKRESQPSSGDGPEAKSQRVDSPSRSDAADIFDQSAEGATFAADEVAVLSVSHVSSSDSLPTEELSTEDKQELLDLWENNTPIEVLVAHYLQKKAAKEIRVSGHPPEFQKKVDEAKLLEWCTITGKNAGRVVFGNEAKEVRQRLPHRIMGSRYVMTIKEEDNAPARVKARWCLQGHLDPDLSVKAQTGDLQSPTLSQVGRNMLFQIISSHRWKMMLGDIKGAFLSAGDLPMRYRPLYASLPAGGIPGVPDDALIEVLGHVYGLNDSPSAWYKKLNQALLDVGFERSQFDSCLYYLRENGKLTGIYGVHVDDCATGGTGVKYEKALEKLKSTFEFRKWRIGDGDFCGAFYEQDPSSKEITMSQAKFVEKIKPMHFTRDRFNEKDSPLTDREVSCLRAINGSLNWLSTQSRPDLATQVSFSQQSFPRPTVADAIAANHAVRRAKQHADQSIRFSHIPIDKLAIMCHSDAAFGNAKAGATQAGYVISFTHQDMNEGKECAWTPAFWKSSRLPRVVSSTLSAEAQSMSCASSMCEWLNLFVSEALDGPRYSHSFWNNSSRRLVMILTDCKSLYDHLLSPSSPTLDDRRTAIDIVILRDSVARMQATLRWIPTDRMIADALTKESPEAFDLIRACIRSSTYQVSPEARILELRSQERDRRKAFAQKKTEHVPVSPNRK